MHTFKVGDTVAHQCPHTQAITRRKIAKQYANGNFILEGDVHPRAQYDVTGGQVGGYNVYKIAHLFPWNSDMAAKLKLQILQRRLRARLKNADTYKMTLEQCNVILDALQGIFPKYTPTG